jgi:negative regulator of sigma E activity
MTTGDQAARASLRESFEENSEQMRLAHESRELLVSFMRAELRDELRIAFAEGLQAALTSEDMWAKVFAVLQKQAAERTGRFFFDGFIAVLTKVASRSGWTCWP